jgi:hypothetical protein
VKPDYRHSLAPTSLPEPDANGVQPNLLAIGAVGQQPITGEPCASMNARVPLARTMDLSFIAFLSRLSLGKIAELE